MKSTRLIKYNLDFTDIEKYIIGDIDKGYISKRQYDNLVNEIGEPRNISETVKILVYCPDKFFRVDEEVDPMSGISLKEIIFRLESYTDNFNYWHTIECTSHKIINIIE